MYFIITLQRYFCNSLKIMKQLFISARKKLKQIGYQLIKYKIPSPRLYHSPTYESFTRN